MCTRPKLINIGAFKNKYITQDWNKTHYTQFKFCPCGMCIECRNMRREEYTQRLKHEIETSGYIASFITLTYRDDELPLLYPINSAVVGTYFKNCPPAGGSTLYKPHAKQFCDKLKKRIRRKYGNRKISYICVGEYGTDGHRPHFHLIVVGLPAFERKMVYDCWNKDNI